MYSVYLICAEIGGEKVHKIGYTRRTPEQRIKEFKTGNASDFYIITPDTLNMEDDETFYFNVIQFNSFISASNEN